MALDGVSTFLAISVFVLLLVTDDKAISSCVH